jgi:bacterioferritin (cytochrome b1)
MEQFDLEVEIEKLRRIRRGREYCWSVMERRTSEELYNKAYDKEEELREQFADILEKIGFFDGTGPGVIDCFCHSKMTES